MIQRTLLAADEAQSLQLSNAVQPSPSGIVSRTLLQTPEARVVLYTFAEGQELTSHASRSHRRISATD